jgi:Tol biopolymer transport system component
LTLSIIKPDGTGEKIIRDNVFRIFSWLPDSKTIIFQVGTFSETYYVDIDTLKSEKSDDYHFYEIGSFGDISSEGIFVSEVRDGYDMNISLIDRSTKNKKLLVSNAYEPSFSPDGKTILFLLYLPSETKMGFLKTEIHTIKPDGTGEKNNYFWNWRDCIS